MRKSGRKNETDLAIVGAGPVGLMAALRAGREGLKFDIFDEATRTGMHSYALALHPTSLDLLADLGLAEDLIPRGRKVEGIVFHRGGEVLGEASFAGAGCQFPFVLVLRQSHLEKRLEQELRTQGAKVRWNHHVRPLESEEENPPRVDLEVDQLERVSSGYAVATPEWVVDRTMPWSAKFVIGADGLRSTVRKFLDIDYRQLGQPETFAVFEFKSNGAEADRMHVILEENRTNVLWPLPDGYCRWSFQIDNPSSRMEPREKERILVGSSERDFPQLTEESLRGFLSERAPWFDGDIGDINWRMVVRFERRLAERLGQGRFWLAGDAAHLTGPVGVQSMNVGLREANTLVERLAPSITGKAAPGPLAAYNDERLAEWSQLLGLEEGYQAGPDAPDWVGANVGRIVPCLPESGSGLENLLQQLGITRVMMKH